MEARIALLPRFDLSMLVGGVVVTDDVNLLIRWNALGNEAQEIEPLLMPMPIHALADDPTARNVHGGKERSYAVTLVVMSHSLTPTFLDRKPGLGPVKCLYLAFLVTGQYNRMLRRREIKANNVFKLLLKVLVIGKLEAFDSMWLQSVCRPHSADAGGANSDLFRHRGPAPMRHALRFGFHRQLDNARSLGRRNRSNTPRARLVLDDAFETLLSITLAPPTHLTRGKRIFFC